MPLTRTAVRQAKPTGKNFTLKDTAGLALVVGAMGAKQWHFRFYWSGKQARISMGVYPAFSLKEAREAQDQARALVSQGVDPRANPVRLAWLPVRRPRTPFVLSSTTGGLQRIEPQTGAAKHAGADRTALELIGVVAASGRVHGNLQDSDGSIASAFIEELLKPQNQGEPVKKAVVDRMIAEIDAKLSRQMDEVLHSPEFQSLEASWRGLKMLVDRTDFRENIKLELLNASKQDLLDDFEDSPEVMQGGLYKHVYTAEYGQFGGQPVGAIIANYFMSPSAPDVKLMQYVSSVSCMSHAPFIAAAGPKFFGLEAFTGLPNLKDLKDHFEGPHFAKWQSFRQSEDSRYMVLTVPRFLLRNPYDPEENPVKTYAYREMVANSHEHYLWGNTAFAFATRLTDSFAKFRWCPNIIGPQSGGAVEDLPLRHFQSMGEIETKIPTEVLISDRREYELAEEGFISLE